MLCKYNGLGPWAVATGLMDSSVVAFIPGPNTIPDEQFALIKDNKEVLKRIKEGKLEILVDSIAKAAEAGADTTQEGAEIGALSVKEAKELIKSTHNTVELKKWQEADTRPGVQSAIEAQLAIIEKDRAADAEAAKAKNGGDVQVE